MTIKDIDYLLLGGGPASVTAAMTLRLEQAQGSILVLSADSHLPSRRPALSKQLLLGKVSVEQILLHPASAYREQGIELALDTQATDIAPAERLVSTSRGDRFRYGHLLIATGVRPVRLALAGADMPGVHYLRTIDDVNQLRQRVAAGARRAIVLGASFLGMETAMSLRALGLEVTIIERDARVMPYLHAHDVSQYLLHHVQTLGVRLVLAETLVAIHGVSEVQAVETASGERLRCDVLFVGIGAEPAADFFADSGIERDPKGLIRVDEQLRTNLPQVFAAGDITSFYDPVFARRRHIEHWDNAIKQGRLAARNMLGQRRRYDEVSYFFCDIGDISFNVLGVPEEGGEHVSRGALAERSYARFYLKAGVPRALFSMGRPPEETRAAEGLIRYRTHIAPFKPRLADPQFPLRNLPRQNVLLLQGGGAMGAFQCGVLKALEEDGLQPDIVAGISIGAFNGAIVAANPGNATPALEAFWAELAVTTLPLLEEQAARAIAAMQILTFGVPNFFQPRWMQALWGLVAPPLAWTSFYDVAPMRTLLARYVNFSRLKASPVRLLVSAVNVETAELEIFDSYVDDLTPEHILASGGLPPGFPAAQIDGQAYWDGGIVSNSPFDLVAERCGPDGKRVFSVSLFSNHRPRPDNMIEVMARRDEIVYAERARSDTRQRELAAAYQRLISGMLEFIEPDVRAKFRQRPDYIQLMGERAATTFTRFARQGRPGEPSSRDYDFSDIAIRANREEGYALARQVLEAERRPVPGNNAAAHADTAGAAPSASEAAKAVPPATAVVAQEPAPSESRSRAG